MKLPVFLVIGVTTVTLSACGGGGGSNIAPSATISGSNTGLNGPYGLALDGSANIYIANIFGHSVTVYPAGSNGNVATRATIGGSNTGLDAPNGVTVDGTGKIYVADPSNGSIHIYPAGSNGTVAPIASISGRKHLRCQSSWQ
jgi:serine/threonine protein kinase, bacterial